MDMPTVAIVGRPNVGKSTLFNRLVGKKLALVDDRPGVTRDRREGDVRFGGLHFRVIDTAGLEESDAATLMGRMRMQTEAAILAADVVLFVIDAREGLGELHEALKGVLPKPDPEDDEEDEDAPGGRSLKVAIVGRPNAGKSTLINRMLGEDRLLVGPEAGITRDSISLDWEWRGRKIKLHDTAGMRRRARIDDKLEKLAVSDGLRAVRFAEVVVVLLDATIPFEKQDLTIIDLVESEGRAVVIGLNKWDLVADQPGLLKQLREDCTRLLPQVRGVAVVPLSGLAGEGLDKLMQAVVQAAEVWDKRISTSRINDWLSEATSRNPPPAVSGRRIKIRYATQVKSRPPHFALFGNQLNALPKSYTRYLVNGLREAFELPGTPIRLSLRTSQNPFDKG
jgi:GTP-binding protein